MKGYYGRRTASRIALAAAALSPAAAFAQAGNPTVEQSASPGAQLDESAEIVVTAQRREERSRDVPISVTSIAPQQLTTANVNQLSDTAKLTPGLRFDMQGASVQPTIRGVGTAITTSGGGPNVGIYVDGFFQSNSYVADFQLLKVQNIQVLKGPQGTLFGRNTTGGAILVTTADPSTTPAADFRVQYGRFGTLRTQGYATFGLTDRIALDVEGVYGYGNGFQTDTATGDDHVGRYRSYSVRTGLKAEVSDDVSVLLRYIHSERDDPTPQLVNAYVDDADGRAGFFDKLSAGGRAAYGRTSSAGLPLVFFYAPTGTVRSAPNEVALNRPVSFRTNSDVGQMTIRADLGFADLTSYTQYRDDRTPYFGDLDATALPIFQIFVGVKDKTVSQEVLLNSKSGSPLQWTVGLNYFQYRDTWDVNASFSGFPFADFGGSSTLTKSYAAFADATYQFGDSLFLTGGLRFSHDVVSDAFFKTNFAVASYTGPNGQAVSVGTLPPESVIPVDTLKNDKLTPRVVLRYKPDQASSLYASYTQGYKAGILNVGGLSQEEVSPERINAFEAGYKYDDRRFAIDIAGYYYDYKNLQVSSYQNGAAQIRNAASSEIYGAEAQLRYRFSTAFNVFGGAAWTHARYKSFRKAPFYSYCDPAAPADPSLACLPGGAGALTQTTTDASGLRMQRAPDLTGNLGASYGLALGGGKLLLSGNVYYSSAFYFDPSEQFRQKGYEVLSLRAEWTDPSEHVSLAVFGDNVTNNRYRTQVLFNTLGIGSTWSAPVTYGAAISLKF